MAKKKNTENKNFRKESKKQEKLLYSVIGVLAIILAFVIVLTKKIDFAACSNTGDAVEEEEVYYEPSPAPLPELFEDEAGGDSTANEMAADTNEAEGATLETTEVVENSDSGDQQNTPEVTETTPEVTESTPTVADTAPAQVTYYFRNSNLLNQHYEKHGIEMGFDSAESYQAAASAVINNPNALKKTEAEDGDGCFYVEATNEFVVLSTDGYIRTYFYPNSGKAYFDRQ